MLQEKQLDSKALSLIPLLDRPNQKPLDFGNGSLSASVKADGRICAINRPHRKHGFITLTSMEQFPNDKWYDPAFVRRYRKQLAESSIGFGVVPQGFTKPNIYLMNKKHPYFHYHETGMEVNSAFFIKKRDTEDYVVQQMELVNHQEKEIMIPVELGGQISLNRSSYGQLTEGGPIPIPPAILDVTVSGNVIAIRNHSLGAQAEITILENNEPIQLGEGQFTVDKPFTLNQMIQVTIQPKQRKILTVVYALCDQSETALASGAHLPFNETDFKGRSHLSSIDWKDFVIGRNIDYIVSCCAVPVHGESICIITDHQLLPLAWNRDAYYMMQLLFDSLAHKKEGSWRQEVQRIIKGHLIWMFEDAERPDGYWGRAYLTNGYSKDPIFQLDQQCYPILELCHYYQEFRDAETVTRLFPFVEEILEMLSHHKADQHWLYKTGETPADDEVEYPYHFSSQVLVWHMFKELAKVNRELQLSKADFGELAEKVKNDCLTNFTFTYHGNELFAYLTDLNGGFQLYHDANDLPTVYAPMWGFCDLTDSAWMETMKFAFSEENKGGYYPGLFGGLGSVHTPHKWPLGDGQELLFALLTGDKDRENDVVSKLKRAVQWDGLFSEAVNETNGEVASRHWFSWPGAFIASVLLKMEYRKGN
jgi:uncharacterized protein